MEICAANTSFEKNYFLTRFPPSKSPRLPRPHPTARAGLYLIAQVDGDFALLVQRFPALAPRSALMIARPLNEPALRAATVGGGPLRFGVQPVERLRKLRHRAFDLGESPRECGIRAQRLLLMLQCLPLLIQHFLQLLEKGVKVFEVCVLPGIGCEASKRVSWALQKRQISPFKAPERLHDPSRFA